jgi:tellurite resistance protein TehA-like permease
MSARRAPPGAIDLLLGALPPASGAMVMGTGIVSIGLSIDGRETLSRILLWLAAAVWVALGVLLPARASRDRARFRSDTRSAGAFSAVAATTVLGARLTLLGWTWVPSALLVVAVVLWLGLLGPVLRHWTVPTLGVSFVLTVGTESLALLASLLAVVHRAEWLLIAALAPFALGLAFYGFVLRSFDRGQLATGEGDHWVTGGALAISTVVAADIVTAAQRLGALDGAVGALKALALTLWALTLAWLPVLLYAEARHRRGRYSVRRWSTVFPVGMYAACSFAVGAAADVPAITSFARVWVWVGVAVWAAVATGLTRAAARVVAPAITRRSAA